ncbi:MAG: choice-of-anchor D domain-containing protein [Sphingobacteriales bacterium]|nr:MAG: choice-of-anchor D domain-containing protein [Sphingobacteriales bacterium]
MEALVNLAGLTAQGITPVKKTLLMDLNANGWPTALEKAEGLAIINDSTIFICNDNDYGQVSPLENGIATATGITSHVIKFGLSGTGKLQNFNQLQLAYNQGITGPSTKQTPYLQPLQEGVQFTSILGAGEKVGNYTMAGLPDGTGAFDNGDGTFTFLVNHEIGNTSGSVRAHGSKGAFVSKWIINKSDLSVVSGSDLIQNINLWNPATSSYITYNAANPSIGAALTRLCSADLPSVSAFYNSKTGKGTTERIFMDGEESGTEGRAFGHIVTGLNGGTSYELPYLGKFSWENSVANPYESDKTVVAGTDDAGGGQIYIYIGEKSTTGNEIEKAGLSGGKLYGLKVTGYSTETSATIPTAGSAFTLADLGNVQNMTGTAINTASVSAGVTGFLRPEDGSWDPSNPSDFYFLTTNAFNSPSRLWKAHFSDVTDLTKGGTITAVLDGTEGQQMLDNMTVDHYGHIIMQEDVGNNVHNGKFWQYTIATDELKVIAQHDPTRFISGGANFLTQDEEGSGVIDAQSILGPGMFLAVDQAHYSISGEVVEGGQLMAFFNPDTYNANPEIALIGNNNNIVNGDITPDAADNTNFGKANPGNTISKTFEIKNDGPGALTVSGISIGGTNAAQFSLVSAPVFPLTLAANSTQNITVKFAPLAAGNYNATVNILSNDFDEAYFNFAISGSSTCSTYVSQIAVSPEYTVSGQQAKTIYLGYGTQSVDLTVSVSNASGNYSYSWSPVSSTDNKITVSPTSTTTYTATITDQYGCTSTENVTVNVIDVRDGNKAKAIICHKGKTLSVGTANVADHLSHGDKLGTCGAGKNTGEEVALSVENENAADFSVNVYPNPSNKQALVSVQLPQAAAMVLSVTDIQGKTVLPASKQYFSAGENQVILNTSTLENGIYFVRLVGANEVKEVKLVIVH